MGIAQRNIHVESILLVNGSLPEALAHSLTVAGAKSFYDSLKLEGQGKNLELNWRWPRSSNRWRC